MFTNNLVIFSFRYLAKMLVGDLLQQRCFGAFHMVIQEPERQSSYLVLVGVKLRESRLDRVDLKTEFIKKISVHSLVLCLDPFVKD